MIRCATCRKLVEDSLLGGFDCKGYPICKECVNGTAESDSRGGMGLCLQRQEIRLV